MNLLSTNIIPVATVLGLILIFTFIHAFIYRFVRRSESSPRIGSAISSATITVGKLSIDHTSVYGLLISLLRLNIIFYAISGTLLNNLFGSDTSTYNLMTIISIFVACEFLWFLKNKDKDSINELTNYLIFICITLTYIAISKSDTNLSIVTNSVVFRGSIFKTWEILSIPIIIIPFITVLAISEQRIITFRKKMYHKTVDGLIDVLSEKLLFFYLVLILIKTLIGGVKDFSFDFMDSSFPLIEVLNLTIKFIFITLIVNLVLRFKSLNEYFNKNMKISIGLAFLLFLNLGIVTYIRGIQ